MRTVREILEEKRTFQTPTRIVSKIERSEQIISPRLISLIDTNDPLGYKGIKEGRKTIKGPMRFRFIKKGQ